MYNAIVLTLKY